MKKYCLTDCMKRKLSVGKKLLIEITAIATTIILVIGTMVVLSAVVGFLLQLGYYLIHGNLIGYIFSGFIEAGVMSLLFIIMIGLVISLGFLGVKNFLYTPIKAVVTNTIQKNEYEQCKIFEECSDD